MHNVAENKAQMPETVLIVEDSEGFNRLLQKSMEREGFLTEQASTGTEALAKVAANPTMIMVLDYILPDMNGKHLIETLRARKYEIPFIIMTGYGDEQIAVDMMKLGARDYLIKQGNIIELLPQMVHKLCHALEQEQRLQAAELAQREAERRFRDVLENMNLLAVIFDTNGNITFCNEYLLTLTGWTQAEILGQNWFSTFIPPDIQQTVKAIFTQAMTTFVFPSHYENDIITKRGERRVIAWNNTEICDANGNVIGINSIGEDITEHKRAEAQLRDSETKYHQLFELGADAIFLVDQATGQILEANAAAADLYGYTQAELLGMRNVELSNEPEQTRQATLGDLNRVPIRWHRKRDGTVFPVEITSARFVWHDQSAYVTAIRDMTERLRAEELLLVQSAAMEAAANGILITDRAGAIQWTNSAFMALSGYTQAEAIGKNPRDLVKSGRQDQAYYQHLWQTILNGQIWQGELLNQQKDGTLYTEEMTITPVRDQRGEISHFIAIKQDITARKRAEEEIKWLNEFNESMIRNMLEGIVIEDAEGCVLFVNPAGANLLGYTSAELMGRHWTTVIPPEQHAIIQAADERRVRGESDRYEVEMIRKDGTRRFMIVSGSPRVEQDRFVGTLAVFSDITERKLAEHTLQQLNAGLEQRVQERMAQLNAVNQHLQTEMVERKRAEKAAEAANRAKSDFLANMSHELRTPLNAILGYAQILKDDDNLTDRQRAGLNTIRTSGDHLLTLITDILDLAKIEAGRMELQATDFYFPEFLRSITDMVRIRAEQKGLTFTSEFDPNMSVGIRADEKRLREVLLNLLGNAVKFTEQGTVTLRVKRMEWWSTGVLEEEKNGNVPALQHSSTPILRFEVEDTGIGIAPEQMSDLFLPFHQVGEARYAIEGTGLGLAISRRLVELMGGALQMQSTTGAGSRFWFEITVPEVPGFLPHAKPATPKIIGYQGERRIVLVADDKRDNRGILTNMLLPLGFRVTEAENGQDCLDKALKFTPDVILLDLRMPGMDGFEVAKQIRNEELRMRNEDLSETPNTKHQTRLIIIAVSATAFAEARERSLAAGCDDFLAKPFQKEDLLALLQRYLQLEWFYAAETEAPIAGDVQPASALAAGISLPPEARSALLHQAMRGNVKGVLEQLDILERLGEQYLPLVDHLRTLAKQFQVDEIVELVERL